MVRKIKFIAYGQRWFDKMNGNTYHSVKITRLKDDKVLTCPMQYGYDDAYKQTALTAMVRAGWIKKYTLDNAYMFERENDYPIHWEVWDGLKRDCVANGN